MPRALLALFVLALLYSPAATAWSWPTGGPGSILRSFSYNPADPHDPGAHRGIDIGGQLGEPVFVPASGTVTYAGTRATGGKTVTIRTADGFTATLQHLGSIAVRRGAVVGENQIAGSVGFSGVSEHEEPYVFLSVRETEDPYGYIDPLELLRIEYP
jgi:murein DD-endopeptidase MepM/ murein hydrolase activator NlpD